MNSIIQLKTTPPLLIALALLCFGLSPKAQAVVPPPDGGYPGGNTAEGQNALLSLTTGGFNTAVGFLSLRSNTEASFNTAIGAGALFANTAGNNTATGAGALFSNTTADFNTANGAFALFSSSSGFAHRNTAIGAQALFSQTAANGNTAVGDSALFSDSTGALNTALGSSAGINVTTANNVICIGAGVAGANVENSCFIGNIRNVQTQNADAIAVLIDSAGQLGTMSSSRRFKGDIKPMDKTSEAILALKPVTFHYKSDTKNMPCFGLIAEEVAEVNPDLVVRDEKGEIYTVRYEAVNAMLLNEFLKEHRKVQEQEATIAQLKSTLAKKETIDAHQQEQIEALTAGLQKVSAQLAAASPSRGGLEASKPAPQVVNNP